jgi:hypothetical protein
MKKITLLGMLLLCISFATQAQLSTKKFGKGLNFYGADSSFHIKFGFRFQNLYQGTWNVANDDLGTITDHNSRFLIRRSRLKFNGFAFSPRLRWKIELALTNRDMANGAVTPEMSNASNLVLDAFADYRLFAYQGSNVNTYNNADFYGMFIRFGQGKLPGNVERVVSSANLQLVDRSLVNSRFNIDRDIGVQIWNKHKVAGNFVMKEKFAVSGGEGRNVTQGSFGGYNYTGRVEFLPLGLFKKDKDDYVGSALTYYEKPKAMVAVGYDINDNAVRNRGQLGSFIQDANGDYVGEQLNTFFADAVVKYKRFSLMTEYMDKKTADGTSAVLDAAGAQVGNFTTGRGLNVQAGMILNKKNTHAFHKVTGKKGPFGEVELVGRLTTVDFTNGRNDENQYTVGFNSFFSGHQLKLQADMSYIDIKGADDRLMFRTQLDVHF